MVYYARLEIDDENGQAMVVSTRKEYLGSKWHGQKANKSNLQYAVRNLGSIKNRIKFGNEARYYLDCIDQTGLVGSWSFDGDAKDDSPPKGKNNGTIENGTWQNGELVFNGESTRIVVGNVLDAPTQVTVCASIRANALPAPGTAKRIVSKYDGAGVDNGAIILDLISTGALRFIINAGGTSRIATTTSLISLGVDYDIIGLYDGATVKVFLKLASDTTYTLAGSFASVFAIPSLTQAWSIGEDSPAGTQEWFNGVIKKVKIHSVAYTDQEITDAGNGKAVSRGLVGYWRLDEGSGTIAYDSVTYKNDGTVSGAVFVDTNYGKGLQFDGIDDYVSIPHSSSVNVGNSDSYTLIFVVKTTSTNIDRSVSEKWSSSGDGPYPWALRYYPVGAFYFAIYDGGAGMANVSTQSIAGLPALNDGNEHVIVCMRDFANSQIRIYVDKSTNVAVSSTVGVANDVSNAINIAIGRRHTDVIAHQFEGIIGPVRLVRGILNASQIDTLCNSYIHNKRVFTGVQLDYDDEGTFNEVLTVTCRDLFDDLRQSESVNAKYTDQEVSTTVIDVINGVNTRRNAGLTTSEIATLDVSQPYNFVVENLDHALTRVTQSSFSELFMRPNKSVVLRKLNIVDSKLEITDANIRDPEKVASRQGISDSYGIIRVVGGLSTEVYDTNKRVIAEHRVPAADTSFSKRVYPVLDERFTTWLGAKMHAMTLADEIGEQYFAFDQALSLHDITKLPAPGELVKLNSSALGINRKFVCDEIEIADEIGNDTIKHIDMKLGKSEYGEVRTLATLLAQFEQDKRKKLDADTDTNQKSFCVSVKLANGVTLTITTRNPATSPYLEGDGSDRASDAKESFATFDDGV